MQPLTCHQQLALLKAYSNDASNIVIGLVRNKDTAAATVAEELPKRHNIHLISGDLTDIGSLKASNPAWIPIPDINPQSINENSRLHSTQSLKSLAAGSISSLPMLESVIAPLMILEICK